MCPKSKNKTKYFVQRLKKTFRKLPVNCSNPFNIQCKTSSRKHSSTALAILDTGLYDLYKISSHKAVSIHVHQNKSISFNFKVYH